MKFGGKNICLKKTGVHYVPTRAPFPTRCLTATLHLCSLCVGTPSPPSPDGSSLCGSHRLEGMMPSSPKYMLAVFIWAELHNDVQPIHSYCPRKVRECFGRARSPKSSSKSPSLCIDARNPQRRRPKPEATPLLSPHLEIAIPVK